MENTQHQLDKLTGHYESVKLQHDNLDTYIAEKYQSYAEDETINDLKKRKLALKDEMVKILNKINELKENT